MVRLGSKDISIHLVLTARKGLIFSNPVGTGLKCKSCNQLGLVKRLHKNKRFNVDKKAAVAGQTEAFDELLSMAKTVIKSTRNNVQLIDSGCSNHMTCGES